MEKYIERIDIIPAGPYSQEDCEMAFLVGLFSKTASTYFKTFLTNIKYPGRTKIHQIFKPSWSYRALQTSVSKADFYKTVPANNRTYYVFDWTEIFLFINSVPEAKEFLQKLIHDIKIVNVVNNLAAVSDYSTSSALASIGQISYYNHIAPSNKIFDMEIKF